jgi:hypothetical protein
MYMRWEDVTDPALLETGLSPDVEQLLTGLLEAPSGVCDNCATQLVAYYTAAETGSHVGCSDKFTYRTKTQLTSEVGACRLDLINAFVWNCTGIQDCIESWTSMVWD